MRTHFRAVPLLALVILTSFSALADTTLICVSKERVDRTFGRVKGKYYSTMTFDSKGLTYWNEYLNFKYVFPKIERSIHSDGLFDIYAGASSFVSLHIQTQSENYIDKLPSDTKVKTWFSLAAPAEGEFLEEPALSEQAECTVQ